MDIQLIIVDETEVHIEIKNYFFDEIPAHIKKSVEGKKIYFSISSLHELICIWNCPFGKLFVPRGMIGHIIYHGSVYEVSFDHGRWNIHTTMERAKDAAFIFQNFGIIVDGKKTDIPKNNVYEDLYDGPTENPDTKTIIERLQKGDASSDKKISLTYKLINDLEFIHGYRFSTYCHNYLGDFEKMKSIENNPVFDAIHDDIPFKYIRFGMGKNETSGFLCDFYKKFDCDKILKEVANFYPKGYIKKEVKPVFVGSSLLQLFGYKKGSDFDVIIREGPDPIHGTPDSYLTFIPTDIRLVNRRASIKTPDGESLDLFKIKGSHSYTVSKFHFPCVKMYIDGDNLFMTPTCMESLYTGNIMKSLIGLFRSRQGSISHIYEKYMNYGFRFVDN